ncbi:MAG: hypothetical protein AAF547_22365 [Actinomycetota bacterium]
MLNAHRDVRDLLALRKAAVLAHWIPGLSLVVDCAATGTVRVSADQWSADPWPTVHPCEFRRTIVQLRASAEVGLAPPLDEAGDGLRIDMIGAPGTEIDESGLVVARFDPEHSVIAFATSGPVDGARWAVETSPDDDLGIVLVHRAFPTEDDEAAGQAQELVFRAMVESAAEEIAALVTG